MIEIYLFKKYRVLTTVIKLDNGVVQGFSGV
jgi:hypothetical protein